MAAFLFVPMAKSPELEIARCEAGMLCNASKHPRSDFLAIMKGKDEVRVACPAQDAM